MSSKFYPTKSQIPQQHLIQIVFDCYLNYVHDEAILPDTSYVSAERITLR